MDSRELPPVFGPGVDARNLVLDDREIDEQTTGANPHVSPILSRELVVRGDALFSQAPNTRHSLRRLQLASSTTKRGQCHRLVPCQQKDDGAIELTFTRFGQDCTGFYRKVDLPSRAEVAEFLFGLDLDQVDELRVKHRALTRQQLINHIPHQGRGDRIIESSALYITGHHYLDTMSAIDTGLLLRAFEDVTRALTKGETPDAEQVTMVQKARQVLDLEYRDIYMMLRDLCHAHAMRAEILGVDSVESPEEKSYDPQPIVPTNWGVSDELLRHVRSRATWEKYLGQGVIDPKTKALKFTTAWTRARINDAAEKLGVTNFLEYNALQANDPPTWDELSKAILEVEESYMAEMEDWQSRQENGAQWVNLGSLVGNLTSYIDGTYRGIEDGYDARPKPGMANEPAHFMNPEEEWLKDRLSGGATPEDMTLWMGDCGPFADMLPYGMRKDRNNNLALGGHPMAFHIKALMDAASTPRDPVALGLQEDSSQMGRITISTATPIQEVEFNGRIVKMVVFNQQMEPVPNQPRGEPTFGFDLDSRGYVTKVYPGSASRRVDLLPHVWKTKHRGDVQGFKRFPRESLFIGDRILGYGANEDDSFDLQVLRRDGRTLVVTVIKDRWPELKMRPVPETGVPVIIDMSTAIPLDEKRRNASSSFSVMARAYYPHPGPGYTHHLKRWDPIKNDFVFINENDPFLRYFSDDEEVPAKLAFRNRIEYLAWRLPVLMVPVIQPVDQVDEYGDPIQGLTIDWQECRSVYPVLCEWGKMLSEHYCGGDSNVTHFFVKSGKERWKQKLVKDDESGEQKLVWLMRDAFRDVLGEVYTELSLHQRNMLERVAHANIHIIEDLYSDLSGILVQAVQDPESLKGPGWGEDGKQTLYGCYFGRDGMLWQTLSRMQGNNNDIILPPQANEKMSLVWRAMGYLVNGDYGPRDRRTLERMVERYYYRNNPASQRRWTIGGVRRMVKPLFNLPVKTTAFSNGILGDYVAQVMNALFPVQIPGLPNLFVPSPEALANAKTWDDALRAHVLEVVPACFWGCDAQRNAMELALKWGRRREFGGRDKVDEAVNRFIEELFPLPRGSSIFFSQEDFGDSLMAQMKAESNKRFTDATRQALTQRLLVRSTVPVATQRLISATSSIESLRQFGVSKMKSILLDCRDELGPLASVIDANIMRLKN